MSNYNPTYNPVLAERVEGLRKKHTEEEIANAETRIGELVNLINDMLEEGITKTNFGLIKANLMELKGLARSYVGISNIYDLYDLPCNLEIMLDNFDAIIDVRAAYNNSSNRCPLKKVLFSSDNSSGYGSDESAGGGSIRLKQKSKKQKSKKQKSKKQKSKKTKKVKKFYFLKLFNFLFSYFLQYFQFF